MKNEEIVQVLEKLTDLVTELSTDVSTLKAGAANSDKKDEEKDKERVDLPDPEKLTDDQWNNIIGNL